MVLNKPRLNYTTLCLACLISLLVALICTWVGVDWYQSTSILDRVKPFLDIPVVQFWSAGINTVITLFLAVSAISGRATKRVFYLAVCMVIPITAAVNNPNRMELALEATSILLTLYLRNKISILSAIKRWILYQSALAVYTFISMYVKLGFGSMVYSIDRMTFTEQIIFRADLYLFQILVLIVLNKGGLYLERNFLGLSRLRTGGNEGIGGEDAPTSDLDRYRRGLRNLAQTALIWGIQLIEFTIVCLTAYFNNKFLVFVFAYLLGFVPQRIAKSMGKAYHADLLYKKPNPGEYSFKLAGICFAQSWIAFFLLMMSVPGLGTSILMPPICGALLALATNWFGWRLAVGVDYEQ